LLIDLGVSGGLSGIGRAAAELYVKRGYCVVAVDIDLAGLGQLPALDAVAAPAGDVSTPEVNAAAVQLALDTFGRLDAAVLNAGIGGGGPLEASGAIERFDRIIAVNLRSVVLGIRAAVPALRAPPASHSGRSISWITGSMTSGAR
jgi:meso-butanediol dehydrogenase / (S,S)-butanediol dehydrogenase / diacetyl reductase